MSAMSKQSIYDMNALNEEAAILGLKSRRFVTEAGVAVNLVCLPHLSLYVITDVNNFGGHWFRVTYKNNTYSVDYLFGGNEDVYSPIARFLAHSIMAVEPEENSRIDKDLFESRTIILNMSLRHTDVTTIRELANQLTTL